MNLTEILISYLSEKLQKVRGSFHDYTSVQVAVPQGSCLGPFMHIAYTNELKNMLPVIDIVSYTDDIAFCFSGDSITTV